MPLFGRKYTTFQAKYAPHRKGNASVVGNSTRIKRRASTRRSVKYTKRMRTRKGTRKGAAKRSSLVTLARRVTTLSRGVNASTGTLTHRTQKVKAVSAAQGDSAVFEIVYSDSAALTQVLGAMPFFDSSTNEVVTVNSSSKLFQNSFNFGPTSVNAIVKNNRVTACRVRVGMMAPKNDTSTGPTESFHNGLTDQGGLDGTSPLVRFSDSQVLQDLWHFIPGTYRDVILSPGAHVDIHATLPRFTYQIATQDSDDLLYRKDDMPCVMFIQVMGGIVNDTINLEEINFGACALTVTCQIIRKITYAAGINIQRTIFLDTERTAIATNEFIQGNQPTAALQSFTDLN